MESFDQFYLDVLRKHYFDFDGKTKRKDFWMFVLFNVLVTIAVRIVAGIIFGSRGSQVESLYSLLLLLPSLGMGVRRLHDIGKSGWWLLIGLVPIIGWFILIYFYVLPGGKK